MSLELLTSLHRDYKTWVFVFSLELFSFSSFTFCVEVITQALNFYQGINECFLVHLPVFSCQLSYLYAPPSICMSKAGSFITNYACCQ